MSEATAELARVTPLKAPAPAQDKSPEGRNAWTAEDLLAMVDDENSYELVQGELTMMVPAGARHGQLTMRLGRAVGNFVEEHSLGEVYAAETGFQLESEPLTIRAPDVAFVRQERIPSAGVPEGFWAIAPDLVIEVISPSETAQQVHEKVADYLQAGTQLLWTVYPATQTVMEYRPPMEARRLTAEDALDGGDVVPGFRYTLKKLFA